MGAIAHGRGGEVTNRGENPRRHAVRPPWRGVEGSSAHSAARVEQLQATLTRHQGRPGSARLRTVLDDGQPSLTRSEADERVLGLLRKAAAPRPETNVRVGDLEVDFYWPSQRIAVEVDGFEFHRSREAFENDRRRGAILAGRGVCAVRVTWRQIERAPEAFLFSLGETFGRAG